MLVVFKGSGLHSVVVKYTEKNRIILFIFTDNNPPKSPQNLCSLLVAFFKLNIFGMIRPFKKTKKKKKKRSHILVTHKPSDLMLVCKLHFKSD